MLPTTLCVAFKGSDQSLLYTNREILRFLCPNLHREAL